MPALHALLLTDIVDSTRLTEELRDAVAADLWSAHDRFARDLIAEWGGREIDKSDGMLVLFDGVSDAVSNAFAYHRLVRQRNLPIMSRVCIHVGPVSLREYHLRCTSCRKKDADHLDLNTAKFYSGDLQVREAQRFDRRRRRSWRGIWSGR